MLIHIRDRRAAIFAFLAIAVLGGTLWLAGASGAQTAPVEPWPAFTMVYRDWGATWGPNSMPGYVVSRLTYRSSRDWGSEILEDSVAPNAVGTRGSFGGNVAAGYNARFQRSASEVYPADALVAPDDWLVPIRIGRLKQESNTTILPTASPDVLELVHTELLPCYPDLTTYMSPTRMQEIRILYRKDGEIPIGLTDTIDGKLVCEITVLEFRLLR